MYQKQQVWVKFDSRLNAALIQLRAVTGHIESYQLSAAVSESDPCSIDIEFLHFRPEFLDELRASHGFQDIGILKIPREFENPEVTRKELMEELQRMLTFRDYTAA
jgi:hypothetical protein